MHAIIRIWSHIIPERALACSFNLEYLLVGGWDSRPGYNRPFTWYDWLAGGWGGRADRDGINVTTPVFGPGLQIQPLEGQERLCPVITTKHEIITDSGGPGKFRGGCGLEKGGALTECEKTVVSYEADRERAVSWGILGGLPAMPQGVWLREGSPDVEYLGCLFSDVPLKRGDWFSRPSSGGGGLGDPLKRDPKLVLEDVIDGYVSPERAKKDYGVVIESIDPEVYEYSIDWDATEKEREYIRKHRKDWLETDPEQVRQIFLKGEIDNLDLYRRYFVLLDRGNKQVLPRSTGQYRELIKKLTLPYWK